MDLLLGILGALGGLIAAAWMAYRSGASDQRARTLEALAEAGKRRANWEAEEDARIERDRLAAIETAQLSLAERREEARVDIDAAEAALRKRTEEPWEP